jgi:acyl-CoA synthetase (AMP-forming)/AMP-acid ligase II
MNTTSALIDQFRRAVRAHPDALFLDGKRQLTYRAVADEVDARAEFLTAWADGLPIVLRGTNTAEWVIGFLAARAAGLVVVPLSDEATPTQLDELGAVLGRFYLYESDHDRGTTMGSGQSRRYLPSQAAVCLSTSGSTGLPRYALRSDRSLLAEGERYVDGLGLASDDRILVALPACHAFALGLALGGAIAAGCSMYLMPRFVPRTIQRLLRQGQVTFLPLVPAAARILCETFRDGGAPPQGLRQVVIGAGALTAGLERTILEHLGRLPARNYGSSETGATLGTRGQHAPDGITGAALPGVDVWIAETDGAGSLFIRTSEPFIGYLLADGVDASRVSPDGWYSTGDVARRDEHGWITITGRIDKGLRRGGRFIQPVEIQQVLLSHPGIADAVVVGRRDEHGEDVVEAHIEVRPGVQLTNAIVHQHVSLQLESYKIPTAWYFYDLLPRTSGGKPDRSQLSTPQHASPVQRMPLMAALGAHRLSTAAIAAQRLGILALAATGNHRTEAIARQLNLDVDGVTVVLKVLEAAGIVDQAADGTYRTAEPLSEARTAAVVELEACLQATWLTVEAVEDVLRHGLANRSFEADPGTAFLETYRAVMAQSAKALALHAWREIALPAGAVLDIGRPAGAWAAIVRRSMPDREVVVVDLPPGNMPIDVPAPTGNLAAVFVHNGIRRLAQPECPVSLASLCAALQPGGVLMIADIFIDGPSPIPWLRSSLMLDWLTHGHLNWRSGADLLATLAQRGLALRRRRQIDPLFELIIVQKVSDYVEEPH